MGFRSTKLPTYAMRENRGQHILDLQLGSIWALDPIQPFLNLHGLDAASAMTMPSRLDPVLDI